MRKVFCFLAVATFLFTACKYDDSELLGRIDNLEERMDRLETLCNQINTNISSLQTIISALQQKDYIESITPITEGKVIIGYTITFSQSDPITIYHGKDGKDGYTPVIGVRKDTDGIYYWTLDGEWLLDAEGNRIKAVGIDGKDGADGKDGQDGQNGADGTNGTDGKDGQDGITPQLKIENDYWYISYDNGATWVQLDKATEGNGEQGNEELNDYSFFLNVDTNNENYVIFTFSDGTSIQLPTWYAFEQLKTLCNEMNTNISALQILLEAIEERDYITSCTPYMENGTQLGYIITFSKGSSIIVYHGKNGTDGKDGVDGEDGYTPIIGIQKDSDDIYYWTLDGEWLHDAEGNRIKAIGIDGKDGADGKDGQDGQNGADGTNGTDGKDGQDGITPQLKIENDYWYISYDNGVTWTQLGKAVGKEGVDGDNFFSSITQDDRYVYFVLADGTRIVMPKFKNNPDIIQFEDRYVKSICVMNWDTNNDGELSYAEASAVTDLEMKFSENPSILCFDELQYFTGLEWINKSGAQFYNCINLARITLPNTVKTLGQEDYTYDYGLFEGCKNLKKIIIPASVEIVYGETFKECSSLEEVSFSEGSLLKSFPYVGGAVSGVFYNCVKLETIDMQHCSSVENIAGYNFAGVVNLKTFKIGTIIPPTVDQNFFGLSDVDETATLYVPYEGILDYAKHSQWGKFLLVKEL